MALDTAQVTAIKRGITARFDRIVGQAESEVFYPTLSTIVNSSGIDEQYAFLGAMPGVREWFGERDFQQLVVLHDRFAVTTRRVIGFNDEQLRSAQPRHGAMFAQPVGE